ncbi:Syntaxin-binding protein 6, partial [Ophiophagus hannah]
MLEQLRQVNGLDPHRDSPEFDLLFENAFDQWVASTASEKCTFFQILHHTCQRYLTDKKPEFINCQSKVIGEKSIPFCSYHAAIKQSNQPGTWKLEGIRNSILHSAADSVTSAVQKASQALNERGERLSRTEEKTEDMKNSAQQFAETAHKNHKVGRYLNENLFQPQDRDKEFESSLELLNDTINPECEEWSKDIMVNAAEVETGRKSQLCKQLR